MIQPVVMEKDQQTILETIKGKVPQYTPELTFEDENNSGIALSKIFAYMAEIAVKRLNSAPQKHFLSFLETINASLIPAQPSRAPLAFKLSERTPENVLIPAATQASASGPDGKPIIFETEKNIMATPANLISVVSVINESDGIKDSIFDHTISINASGLTDLFSGENRQEHLFYIGDKNLLNVQNAKFVIRGNGQNLGKLADSNCVTWFYSKEEIVEKKNDKEIKKISWGLLDIENNEPSTPYFTLKKDTLYLFTWNELTGLKESLTQKLDMDWIKTAQIEQTGDGKTKKVIGEKNFLLLKLDNIEVDLKTDNFDTDGLIAKYENDKLNVYNKNNDFLFNWDEVPEENIELKKFLTQNYGVEIIELEKNNDGKTIKVSTKYKSLSLILGAAVVNLVINDIRTIELIAKYENGKLKVYEKMDSIVPNEEVNLNGFKSRWIRCKVNNSKIEEVKDLEIFNITISSEPLDSIGVVPDLVFTNDIPIDIPSFSQILSYPHEVQPQEIIFPFGVKPQIFNTFYIANKDAFSKTGYEVCISFNLGPGKSSDKRNMSQLSWEYWDGETWRSIENISYEIDPKNTDIDLRNWVCNKCKNYSSKCCAAEWKDKLIGNVKATIEKIPEIKPTRVNGKENYWIRIRLIGGDYGKEYTIDGNQVMPGCFCPPILNDLTIYYKESDQGKIPEYLLAKNNLELKAIQIPFESKLKPFEPLPNEYPAVYFGFDNALKDGPFSLFISIDEIFEYPEDFRPRVRWKYKTKDGTWKDLDDVLDETGGFTRSGVVQFVVSDAIIGENMFGSENDLYWICAEVTGDFFNIVIKKDEEEKLPPKVLGFFLNTTWALQSKTITDEVIGSSNGERDQIFHLLNLPVLNEKLWVNEFGNLTEEERKHIQDIRETIEKRDEKNNLVEFWVKWTGVEDLVEENDEPRRYMIYRASGEVRFGDGKLGMVPPNGLNNIKATYSTGGGKSGNVGAGQISKLQSAVPFVDKVSNPVSADGGTDTEELDALLERAPILLRHRNRAVALEDFEWLTKQASRKVAMVKVLPNFNAQGKFERGQVTIVIVPQSSESKPTPSSELRRRVKTFLLEKSSNIITLNVMKPSYFKVEISAVLKTRDIDVIPVVERDAKTKITEFLHPLTGGPEGKGWNFGSVPCVSDIYSILADIKNIDYVTNVAIKLKADKDSKVVQIDETTGATQLPEFALIYSGEHDMTAHGPEVE
jgi:hypothetical protein